MARDLAPWEPGVRLNVGVSGSGKSHLIRRQIEQAARTIPVMVLDRMHEWTDVPADIAPRARGAKTVADAAKLVSDGARLVIVRPSDIVGASEEACAWARDYPDIAGVAVPEAHRVAPNARPLSTAVEDVACAWRHHRVALWLDTQRFALISRTLTEQARETNLFAIVGERDGQVIKELGGTALVTKVREAASRLAEGEPGWHVRLGLVRVPPYELRREGS